MYAYTAPFIVWPLVVALLLLTGLALVRPTWREVAVTRVVITCLSCAAVASWITAASMWWQRVAEYTFLRVTLTSVVRHVVVLGLRLDSLALPFILATTSLGAIVAVFSKNYLWRDPGHGRFFLLVVFFTIGMVLVSAGDSFQMIFIGWEVIGLSSALLISFFFERPSTSDAALRAFWVYRVSDVGLLVLAMLVGEVVFTSRVGADPLALEGALVWLVPILVLVAAAPKSAQFPFSAWLPRAMEGPTPSSAIFYGGLSVHAGLFLVLRASKQFMMPWWFFVLLAIMGLVTAIYGSLLARVQPDIKSSLAYASMTQVGVMFVEVALGFRTLVVLHFIGHACVRTYQILSAGSLLHEGRLTILAARAQTHGQQDSAVQRSPLWFSVAFDWSNRDLTGPRSMVARIESVSNRLSSIEEWYGRTISRLCAIVIGR